METQGEILALLYAHTARLPEDAARLTSFISFVNGHEGNQLFDRKNFTGHITASAFIIDQNANELLLLKHKFLDRWLQPGGHIDRTDSSLMASALREAEEETGLAANDLLPIGTSPIDFHSHDIPENARRQEAAHYHHDVRFLFRASKAKQVSIAKEESTDSKWIPFSDLTNDTEFADVIRKIRSL